MSIIKQLATYDGSAWTKDDIGANAGNVSLSSNIAGSNNVQGALSNLCGASKLAGNRMVITGSSGILTTKSLTADRVLVSDVNGIPAVSTITSSELNYLTGVTSRIQTQINTLNSNLTTANNNINTINTHLNSVLQNERQIFTNKSVTANTTNLCVSINLPSAGTYLIIGYAELKTSGSKTYNIRLYPSDSTISEIQRTIRPVETNGGGGINTILVRVSAPVTYNLEIYPSFSTTASGELNFIRISNSYDGTAPIVV